MTACMVCVRLENQIAREKGDLSAVVKRAHYSQKARDAIPGIKENIAELNRRLEQHIKETHQ